MTIKMENGKHCIFDGEKKMECYSSHEEAEAAMKDMEKGMMKRMAESLGNFKLTREAMKDLCPKCFEVMTEKNITAVSIAELAESEHFKEATGFSQEMCDAMGGDEGFFTRCAEKMQSKVDDPKAFCAALHKHCVGKYPAEESKITKDDIRAIVKESVAEAINANGNLQATIKIEGHLLESSKDGKEFDVVLIEAGKSKNIHPELRKQVNYSEKVLRDSVHLFDGIGAFTYEFQDEHGKIYDHIPDNLREAFPDSVPKAKVGWYEKPYFAEFTRPDGTKGKGIIARFKVAASWLRDRLKNAWELGNKSFLGFSIDAGANIDKSTGDVINFNKLDEVTVVTSPAAGGIMLRLVASNNKHNQQESEMKEILAWLRQNHAKLVESLKDDEPEETLRTKIFEALNKALALPQNNGVTPDVIKAMIAETVKGYEDKIKGYEEQFKSIDSTVSRKVEEILSARNTEASKLATSKAALDKKLTESTLPLEVQQEVREEYDGQSLDDAKIDAILARRQKTYASLKESGVYVPKQEREAGVTIKQEEFDKHNKAMYAMIINQPEEGGVKAFKSLHESYRVMAGISAEPHEMGAMMFNEAGFAIGPQNVKESKWRAFLHSKVQESAAHARTQESLLQVSTWAEAFGDSVRRALLFYYQWPDYQEWKKIVSTIASPPDFRTNRRIRVGGFGDLSAVTEGSTYTELAWPADEEATYAVSKRGNLLPLTMETMVDDDLGTVRSMPQRLGLAASRTLWKFVFDFIRTNPTIYDGGALFTALKGNLRTSALAGAALETAIYDMMKRTELSSGERIGIRPKYILTSVDGARLAFEQTKASVSSYSGRAETIENWFKEFGLEPITPVYWTDTNDWALCADPRLVPTIEVGFLGGQQEPEIFIQDGATIGSVFTADKITWKIRHIYSGAVVEDRGLHKSEV